MTYYIDQQLSLDYNYLNNVMFSILNLRKKVKSECSFSIF